jgi:hypothetical protein
VVSPIHFVRTEIDKGRDVTVLLAQVEPRRRRGCSTNKRGPILAAAIRARTNAIVATLAIRLD